MEKRMGMIMILKMVQVKKWLPFKTKVMYITSLQGSYTLTVIHNDMQPFAPLCYMYMQPFTPLCYMYMQPLHHYVTCTCNYILYRIILHS